MTRNSLVRLLAVLAIGASACSGSDGDAGAQGPSGPAGADGAAGPAGQDGMSDTAGKLKLVIDSVATTTGTDAASTVTFTVFPASAVCPGGTCDENLGILGQKTFYASEYDPATRTFPTAKSFSFTGHKFKGLVDGGKGAQYTAKRANPSFAPELSQSAMIYGYVADERVLPAKGHYSLYDNVSSASLVYGAVGYESAATVSGCEKCHDAPYSKHGYRQARVAGLPDMASCKACHTDQRNGGHQAWQLLVDDPAAYAASHGATDAGQNAKYAYTANTMNDTHMSHAMEFAYPQSMANCVTCHEGKLDMILTDAMFTPATCKSCHPVTGPATGTDAKRAPALKAVMGTIHGGMNLYTVTTGCNACHNDSAATGIAPSFKEIHSGYDKLIYTDVAGALVKYSEAFTAAISDASAASNVLAFTVTVTENTDVAGLSATDVLPRAYIAPYGLGTKDFILAAKNQALTAAPAAGWTITPGTATATTMTWAVTADLAVVGGTTWTDKIADTTIQRVELGVMPFLPNLDGVTYVPHGATAPATAPVALNMVTKTFDLVGNAFVAASAPIVDVTKCNACHDALGTTFHTADRGGSIVGCRLCHTTLSGGSHLEMQSRSIDSYVHAIHSFQPFDIGDVVFTNPVEALHVEHHIGSTYPNFSILNCESCHNPGTYEVPDQAKSLPGILSAADVVDGRGISGVPSYVTGPASRACGACHRAVLINADDPGSLAAFNAHTASFGTLAVSGTGILDAVTANIMAAIGGPATLLVAPEGTRLESCEVCHAGAGASHQARYNRYADGL